MLPACAAVPITRGLRDPPYKAALRLSRFGRISTDRYCTIPQTQILYCCGSPELSARGNTNSVQPPGTVSKALVAEVLKLIEHEAVKRRITVDVALQEGLPAVLCDRIQIQQVLLNLTLNAMDALDATPRREKMIRFFSNWDGSESLLLGIPDYGAGPGSTFRFRLPVQR